MSAADVPGADAACLLERVDRGRYRSRSPEATAALGGCLGGALRAGDLVILSGDLGAGKTRFTGGVSAALGDARPVTSPTFTIMAVHDSGRMPLYHFDLYRLDDPEQLDDVGIFDALEGEGACLVEWGERFADELGDDRLDLAFMREEGGGADGEPARLVVATALGARSARLLDDFDARVRTLLAP
jgi:tRNA threonylcarbamoyladenosine biosynthesis protein TsaE